MSEVMDVQQNHNEQNEVVMPQARRGRPRKASQNEGNGETTDPRVGIQLDSATGEKLDRLAAAIGERAGEALGITIRVTRTDVVRSLIDSKIEELDL